MKSNTVIGDEKHPSGVVMAEVIKANIPVRNGVVHLIDRPLMVIDATVQEFVEVCQAFYILRSSFCQKSLFLNQCFLPFSPHIVLPAAVVNAVDLDKWT